MKFSTHDFDCTYTGIQAHKDKRHRTYRHTYGKMLQPIDLRTAFIKAAEKILGKEHQELWTVEKLFVHNFMHKYPEYIDYSIKFSSSIKYKSALIKAKQDIENIGIDFGHC